MNIAAIIVGIEGWQRYTLPLIQSIQLHEPEVQTLPVDNASAIPYLFAHRTDERLCYSAAINFGARFAIEPDWYIVLSNDVLCTAPFAHILEAQDGKSVVGPLMKDVYGFPYLEGWCVCVPKRAWDAVGGWDEEFLGSDWEDVAFSTSAREHGFGLIEDTALPFKHLDQQQRYSIVENFAGKNAHNQALFMRKHGQRVSA